MRIALSGVQCVGKTTLLNELKKLNNPNFTFLNEIVRSLPKNIKINEDGDSNTQDTIMNKHLKFIDETDNDKVNITDRCILDCLSYGFQQYLDGKVTSDTIEKHFSIFLKNIEKYDIIFYIAPEFDIVRDDVRSTNIEYRNNVEKLFRSFLNMRKGKVVYLTGSVQNRMKMIIKSIEEYK